MALRFLLILLFSITPCTFAAWDHFVFSGAVICRYPDLKFSYHIFSNEANAFWDEYNTGRDEVRYQKLSPQYYNFTATNDGEAWWPIDHTYEVYFTVNHNCFNRATAPPTLESLRARFDVGYFPVNGRYHYFHKDLDLTDVGEPWNMVIKRETDERSRI